MPAPSPAPSPQCNRPLSTWATVALFTIAGVLAGAPAAVKTLPLAAGSAVAAVAVVALLATGPAAPSPARWRTAAVCGVMALTLLLV